MMVPAMQGADQHIKSSLRFSILSKDTSTADQGNWTTANRWIKYYTNHENVQGTFMCF